MYIIFFLKRIGAKVMSELLPIKYLHPDNKKVSKKSFLIKILKKIKKNKIEEKIINFTILNVFFTNLLIRKTDNSIQN